MAKIEFCGEEYLLEPERVVVIGHEGDVEIDDNQYLHRHFLRVYFLEGLWWLENMGTQLAATVSDEGSGTQAYLPPGGRLPLVFASTVVRFSAGSTTYELTIQVELPVFESPPVPKAVSAETTTGRPGLTPDQRLLVVALAEPALRRGDRSISALPSSAEAAARLGWPLTKFNRKLDNVCQKLTRAGVRGLHGGPERLASNRRFRLVEYALAVHLVSSDDLRFLDTHLSQAGTPRQ